MNRAEVIELICKLFERKIKGQIQIDFSGDGQKANIRFTNISPDDLEKLESHSDPSQKK